MKVRLLGTGAADGWPNPFCTCRSCRDALAAGIVRGQTAALVDDTLMIDCGPEAPRAALHQGVSLAGVRHILVTHAHSDHLGAQALLFRSWAADSVPLDVVGPPDVLRACRQWVGPDDPVRFLPAVPGEVLAVGGYRVRVLPAAHRVFRDGDAVLYDVLGPQGDRILWACDTGPLPPVWFGGVAEAAFDAVFLEETFGDDHEHGPGHHDLVSFDRTCRSLRSVGAAAPRTDIVAVHLGHRNPPERELTARLAAMGARPGRDGEVVVTGVAAEPAASPHRTLVLGGVRSGKSSHAETLFAADAAVTYVATGTSREDDEEWTKRVAVHRERRPNAWRTVETSEVAAVLRDAKGPVLVDCLGTWLTARLDHHGAWESGDTAAVEADVDDLVAAWRDATVPVVAVSNEVGAGVVPATASGRLFRDLLGVLNTRIAADSTDVTLLVAGIAVPLVVAGEPRG
ncbi:bifunctional adenosylcobinamide kinase/adenosylcobinamide-phosphate guanylyltransferase [Rhodococcus rhodnii]|uniref:Adenosylcobinamide kinase n=2 Tax=Rhodococcus rhodnii TaxID=38312 RepID=R7WV42_9NOCA|nr:bifunctional adenosylcobinamide kinase/adenosylcobinamide-phosphate guanylyltransferase [Rhodococcus rhodnii]EOM78014.1 bifunctional adenosylcobinamide kinase [Rhodococcus rhodnii LMG 5362]TXG92073.1 bifunctional adenosylcobinamide kinase/adenosylcobinamide-phosphate guanylyltransferase [Rhodococcus rhodnii]